MEYRGESSSHTIHPAHVSCATSVSAPKKDLDWTKDLARRGPMNNHAQALHHGVGQIGLKLTDNFGPSISSLSNGVDPNAHPIYNPKERKPDTSGSYSRQLDNPWRDLSQGSSFSMEQASAGRRAIDTPAASPIIGTHQSLSRAPFSGQSWQQTSNKNGDIFLPGFEFEYGKGNNHTTSAFPYRNGLPDSLGVDRELILPNRNNDYNAEFFRGLPTPTNASVAYKPNSVGPWNGSPPRWTGPEFQNAPNPGVPIPHHLFFDTPKNGPKPSRPPGINFMRLYSFGELQQKSLPVVTQQSNHNNNSANWPSAADPLPRPAYHRNNGKQPVYYPSEEHTPRVQEAFDHYTVSSTGSRLNNGFNTGASSLRVGNERPEYRGTKNTGLALKVKGSNKTISILEMSGHQEGSHHVQDTIEHGTAAERQLIFEEICDNALQMMCSLYGNYIVQRMICFASPSQAKILEHIIRENMVHLSKQEHGCRVVQMAIEKYSLSGQVSFAMELQGDLMPLLKHQNAHHVIQKIIECVDHEFIKFIVMEIRDEVDSLSKHQFGCRVVQKLLAYGESGIKATLYAHIERHAREFSHDPYANYVIQNPITQGPEDVRDRMIQIVLQNVDEFALSKFSSNVVEKCIEFGTFDDRRYILAIFDEAYRDSEKLLPCLIKSSFGNYVVQTLLQHLDEDGQRYFIDLIEPHIKFLSSPSTGGRSKNQAERKVKAKVDEIKRKLTAAENARETRRNRRAQEEGLAREDGERNGEARFPPDEGLARVNGQRNGEARFPPAETRMQRYQTHDRTN